MLVERGVRDGDTFSPMDGGYFIFLGDVVRWIGEVWMSRGRKFRLGWLMGGRGEEKLDGEVVTWELGVDDLFFFLFFLFLDGLVLLYMTYRLTCYNYSKVSSIVEYDVWVSFT